MDWLQLISIFFISTFQKPFSTVSKEAIDLIKKLLVVNTEHRFTASKSLDHPWLTTSYLDTLKNLETAWIRKYLARRRWQRWFNAIKAMNRFVWKFATFIFLMSTGLNFNNLCFSPFFVLCCKARMFEMYKIMHAYKAKFNSQKTTKNYLFYEEKSLEISTPVDYLYNLSDLIFNAFSIRQQFFGYFGYKLEKYEKTYHWLHYFMKKCSNIVYL